MMVRVEDPLVPRAMFGILNTLLYFPSGAIYPIAAFPGWLRAIARVDPFTYAVHGFKAVLLKDGRVPRHGPRPAVPVRDRQRWPWSWRPGCSSGPSEMPGEFQDLELDVVQ